MNILKLNELTLPLLLVFVICRKPVFILGVAPLFPPLQSYLDRLAAYLIARQQAAWAVDLVPELRPAWDYDRRLLFKEAFKKYELWQNSYFDFNWAEGARQPYGYAYKLVVSNHIFTRAIEVYLIEALVRQHKNDGLRFFGVLPDSYEMCRALFGGPAVDGIRPAYAPNRLVNLVIIFAVLVVGLVSVIRRLRPFATSRKVFFAFDWLNDDRDFRTCESVADGGDVVLIYRNDALWRERSAEGAKYLQCQWKDGVFPLVDGLRTLAMVVADSLYLWRHLASLPSALFYKAVIMPHQRAKIRSLFNRYRPKYVWGRDDYNVEHILRRAELHRIGGRSLGTNHGVVTNFCSLFPQWRYISFDIYYTFGKPLCEPYLSTWAKDMTLRSSGVFGLPRETIISGWPPGEAILFSARVAWNEPEFGRMVHAIAEAFPEREILIQLKRGYISDEKIEGFATDWGAGHSNVSQTTESIYALMARARYYISDVSTVIAEAMHLGVPVLFADVIDQEYSVYREFPGLSIRTADEMVERLRALEEGREIYPHELYQKLMDLDHGNTIYDLVRDDVGLPPLIFNETTPNASRVTG